jgi:RNA polymerase sigma factor (sigma-70 family)
VQVDEKRPTKQECDISGSVQRAAAVFFEHGDFIHTVIRHRIQDDEMVEDLFHNFFLSLVSKPVPSDVHDVKGYIYRAIINDITDHARSLERYKKISHRCSNFDKIAVNNQLSENAFIEKEQTNLMLALIRKRVTDNEYEAIASRYSDGLSIKETAARMNIKGRSVSRYISTGFRKVKEFLTIPQEAENDSTQL